MVTIIALVVLSCGAKRLPPTPFMDEIGKQGLPWHMKEMSAGEQKELFAVKT